ncbi:MAG: ATP-binding protein [Chloroflexota bacterium]
MAQSFVTLVQTVFLLFGFTFLFGQALPLTQRLPGWLRDLVFGVAFGLLGVFNLALAVILAPGIILDIRSPLMVIAAYFGGWRGGLVAAGFVGSYRALAIGGVGVLGGVGAIFTSALIGYWAHRSIRHPRVATWVLLGLAAVANSIIWSFLTLPADSARLFLENFIPTATILYPVTLALLGYLLCKETARVSLDARLRISEARFRVIFNEAFQLIGLLSPDGVVLEANDTALQFAGVRQQDVVGKYFWETPWWANSEAVRAQLRDGIRRAAQGEHMRYRIAINDVEGRDVMIDFSLKPVTDESGKVVLLIPQGRDITSELEAEAHRLALALEREHSRLLQQFIQDSSHHLRTPITIMRTSSYLMKRQLVEGDSRLADVLEAQRDAIPPDLNDALVQSLDMVQQTQRRLTNFEDALDDLTHLIDDLIELVDLEKDLSTSMQPQDITTVVHDIVSQFKQNAEHAGLKLNVRIAQSPVICDVDVKHFHLIMQNLIENAIRYTPNGESITVQVTAEGDLALITVEDTGIGIPEADLTRIFERFYRGNKARSRYNRGSGLGLSIVKQAVNKHQGTITVSSAIDRGTTFEIRLPISSPNKPPARGTSTRLN